MGSPIDAFKQQRIVDFTLPSGLVLTVRKPQQWDFLSGGELPLPKADGSSPPVDESLTAERLVQNYTEQAMLHCVIDPQLCTGRREDGRLIEKPGYLHIDYLSPTDYAALARELLRLGGFLPEDANAIDAFRTDTVGAIGEGPGRAVPHAAVSGDAGESGGDVLRLDLDLPTGSEADTATASAAW